MEDKVRSFYFDFSPNGLSHPGIRKQVKPQIEKRLLDSVEGILNRGEKVRQIMTDRIGPYLELLKESKWTYELGLYYSTISMIGITAEKFAMELSSKLRFRVNKKAVSREEIFGDRFNQFKRLRMLHKAELINDKMFNKLDEIRNIRNKYIHPRQKKNPEKDSIKMLNMMIDALQSDFSDKYEISKGRIVLKSLKK